MRGMRELIKRCRNLCMVVEYNPKALFAAGTSPAKFIEFCLTMGFKINVIHWTEKRLFEIQNADEVEMYLRQYRGNYVNLLC